VLPVQKGERRASLRMSRHLWWCDVSQDPPGFLTWTVRASLLYRDTSLSSNPLLSTCNRRLCTLRFQSVAQSIRTSLHRRSCNIRGNSQLTQLHRYLLIILRGGSSSGWIQKGLGLSFCCSLLFTLHARRKLLKHRASGHTTELISSTPARSRRLHPAPSFTLGLARAC
jgi:hypothetical protein